MALLYSEPQRLGTQAPEFCLKSTSGAMVSLEDFANGNSAKKALVVIFMCNHCPYVKAVKDRINQIAKDYAPRGVALVAINPNDSVKYPDDSFEMMKKDAEAFGYVFPYLADETQEVARAFHAVCTPDPFVYENVGGKFLLRYQGRIDDNWKEPDKVTRHELREALDSILARKEVYSDQKPSMGCSIKWK